MPQPYAATTTRRTVQIPADVFVMWVVVLCVWLTRARSSGISSLPAAPPR